MESNKENNPFFEVFQSKYEALEIKPIPSANQKANYKCIMNANQLTFHQVINNKKLTIEINFQTNLILINNHEPSIEDFETVENLFEDISKQIDSGLALVEEVT